MLLFFLLFCWAAGGGGGVELLLLLRFVFFFSGLVPSFCLRFLFVFAFFVFFFGHHLLLLLLLSVASHMFTSWVSFFVGGGGPSCWSFFGCLGSVLLAWVPAVAVKEGNDIAATPGLISVWLPCSLLPAHLMLRFSY